MTAGLRPRVGTLLPTLPRLAAGALRRRPLAVSMVIALLAMGVLTGTLWSVKPSDTGLLAQLSYGLPSVQDGRWWTFLSGAVILPRPEFYLLVGILIFVGVGAFERRVGALRAGSALIGTQLVATVGTALLLAPVANSDWPWAQTLGAQVDLGLSAGALGVAGAATALLSQTWRRRIRAAGFVYLGVLLLKSGLLWDIEHLLAFTTGVAIGPALAGRRILRPRLPHRDPLRLRGGMAVILVAIAFANLVETVYPGLGGPFGNGAATHAPMHGFLIVAGEVVVALLVADALRRGRAAAWWLAVVGTGAIMVNSVFNNTGALRWADAVSGGVVLIGLVIYRDAWQWRTPDGFAKASLYRVAAAVAAFVATWAILLWLLRNELSSAPTLVDATREAMSRFTFSTGPLHPATKLAKVTMGLATLGWAVVLIRLLIPWLYADRGPGSTGKELVGTLLRRHGGGSLGWMRTWPAFSTWTTADGRTAISYCVVGTVAIAIGDPVGPASEFGDAVREFTTFCRYAGWTTCWFAATVTLVQSAHGWRATQIGDDTVVDLTTLSMTGKSWQDVRTARNRAAREGITMITGRLADFPPDLRTEIERISTQWVHSRSLPEMGFTLGTVGHALDPEMRTHLAVDADGRVQGVTTWLPVHTDGEVIGWTLDLMRRRPTANLESGEAGSGETTFRPVMEYLIGESMLLFREQGYRTVSLSVAPLARRSQPGGERTPLDRTLDLLSRILEPAYGFRSLMAFKAKFHPEFQPVYLVYRSRLDLAAISLAIGRAYLPNLDTRQAAQLLRGMLRHGAKSAPVPA